MIIVMTIVFMAILLVIAPVVWIMTRDTSDVPPDDDDEL